MDEQYGRSALLSALTTEHFVLQTANNSTYSEASARSTLYVMALSSSLVAIGFVAGSTDLLIPFAAIVLPVIFLLGIFTVVRLVETALEACTACRELPASGAITALLALTQPTTSRRSMAGGRKRKTPRSGLV